MRNGTGRAMVALSAMLVSSSVASAEMLRIGGTGAATEVINYLAVPFAASAGLKIEVTPSLGSSGGIRALREGVLDIAVSGRPLNTAERARGMTDNATFRTPYALATSHPNPDGLASAEVARFYQSEDATWADGKPVRIILRPKSDSDSTLLAELFPGVAAALGGLRTRRDVWTAPTDQDNADAAERIPGSLTGITLTQVKLERRNLRLLVLDGVAPTLENFENGTYRFGKTLYFVVPTKPSPAAERFLAFLQSPAGHKALRETDILPGTQ